MNLPVVFFAGVATFVSPCVLPLVPAYLSFISGCSLDDISYRGRIWKDILPNVLLFILGFSLVFIILGATATSLSKFLSINRPIIRYLGGGLIILLGIYNLKIIPLGRIYQERRFHISQKPLGYLGSILVGAVFAFGWTPCVGPILAAILVYAAQQETILRGITLLSVYSLGLGVPFLLSGIAIGVFFDFFRAVRKFLRTIEIVSGGILILLGILLLTDKLTLIVQWFTKIF